MTRKRIVLETAGPKKDALVDSLNLRGDTLSDWFEDQVATSLHYGALSQVERTDYVDTPTTLDDSAWVLKSLSSQDWSFTDDDTRYLTHDLHPYPAKFIPQIPANIITRLSLHGDVVFDPFGGSATTAVEAVRLGRRAISMDANPLSALIGRVKTSTLNSSARIQLKQLALTLESHVRSKEVHNPEWWNRLTATHNVYIPGIPNIEKWFSRGVVAELALIKYLIAETTSDTSSDIANLALSRIIVRVSNQESETRYVSVPKEPSATMTLRAYLETLQTVVRRLEAASSELQYANAKFLSGDSRTDIVDLVEENSVDLIVTSPPYANATDYHLYHRFRMFWLSHDPRTFGQVEIGSHLRHQRNGSGIDEYKDEMGKVIKGCGRVLAPGRYAVFVVGDSVFQGVQSSTSSIITDCGVDAGLEIVGIIERPLHNTKRSFAHACRRARCEYLVVLKKPNTPISTWLKPPKYKMWPYEENLRLLEVKELTGIDVHSCNAKEVICVPLKQPQLWNVRRLTFTRSYTIETECSSEKPTWQDLLENGSAEGGRRKDPKFITHGLHPYKGKFYPQLAKSLLNISGAPLGGHVFDPYCGSGTFLLEGMLNGFSAYGCDFNPLAAKIARAKTSILCVPKDIVELSVQTMLDRSIKGGLPKSLDNFQKTSHEELLRWFPEPVLYKLNWLIGQVRLFGEPCLVDFFEVIISSFIREVSHQDVSDLRIRRKKVLLNDAPVFELFKERLAKQHERLIKYWSIASAQPGKMVTPVILHGDSRASKTLGSLGIAESSIDCVVTSPPYATALPYIDTDRLSLLALMGLNSSLRVEIEENLTGSREIRCSLRKLLESELNSGSINSELPSAVVNFIRDVYRANNAGTVGFRRANMSALLLRYFRDMRDNLTQVLYALKPGGKAFYVVGDSRTKAGENWVGIETCEHIASIGQMVGLNLLQMMPIDVTTENLMHIKNAITKNQVIVFEKPKTNRTS